MTATAGGNDVSQQVFAFGPGARRASGVRHPGRLAVALAGVLLLASACTGPTSPGVAGASSPPARSSTGASSSPSATVSAGAVAYSVCMRHHGLPNFPDPDSNGRLPKTSAQQLGVSTSAFQAAERACQDLYPTSSLEQCSETGVCSPADRQELLNRMREFAQCMRDHGVPDFPDPRTGSDGTAYFDLMHLHSLNPRSQAFEHKSQACFPKMGGINVHVARP